MIEQLGVGGFVAERPQIVGGRHEATSEDVVPQPVHQYPADERVRGNDEILGQREATTPGVLGIVARSQHLQMPTRDHLPQFVRLTTDMKGLIESRRLVHTGCAARHRDFGLEAAELGHLLGEPRQLAE